MAGVEMVDGSGRRDSRAERVLGVHNEQLRRGLPGQMDARPLLWLTRLLIVPEGAFLSTAPFVRADETVGNGG